LTTYEQNRQTVHGEIYPPEPPTTQHLWAERGAAIVGVIVAILYLSNIGFGLVELLPDNLPLVGNLDEAFFTLLLVTCLRKLGIDLLPHLRGWKK
jgi:hypothetical protein